MNIFKISILFAFFISLPTFAGQGSTPPFVNKDVVDVLNKEYLKLKSIYEKKLAECQKNRKKIELQNSQLLYLSNLGMSEKDIGKAVVYLGMRNEDLCVNNVQKDFYFSAGLLKTAKKMNDEEFDELENIQDITANSVIKSLDHLSFYLALPQTTKDYFDGIFGFEPFNMIKAVNSIKRQ